MLRSILLTSSAICTATLTNAATFNLENYHPGPLQAVTEVDGSFDLSDFVMDLADDGMTPEVSSATVSVFGYSAANNSYSNITTGTFTYYTYTRTRHSRWWGGSYYSNYYGTGTGYENTVTQGDTEPDVFVVDFGDTEVGGSTDGPNSTYTQNTGAYSSYSYYRYYSQGATRRTLYETGYDYGTESDSATLLPNDFADLLNNNLLDYRLTVSEGVFDSVTVKLALDYDAVAIEMAPVPLPASMMFLGTSVLGFVGLRRRKKAASA